MTKDELLARLRSIEWSDIEFKEATWAVPKDALSTVSAFANTTGGYLVFGVKQTNGTFTITPIAPPKNQHVTAELADKKSTDQVTDQACLHRRQLDRSLDRLSDEPRSMAELMTHTGFSHRPHFVTTHLAPLLAGGVLRLTLPDKPRSPNQQYVLTDVGAKLKTMHGQAGIATEQEQEQ